MNREENTDEDVVQYEESGEVDEGEVETLKDDVLRVLRQAQSDYNAPINIVFHDVSNAKAFGRYIRDRPGLMFVEGISRDDALEEIFAGERVNLTVRLNPGLENCTSGGAGVHLDRLATILSVRAKILTVLSEGPVSTGRTSTRIRPAAS